VRKLNRNPGNLGGMVMYHNNLPFQANLRVGNLATGEVRVVNLRNFTKSVDDVSEEPSSIIEYQPLEIEFLGNDENEIPTISRLYLDGLDALNVRLLSDWDGFYIECNTRLNLYKKAKNIDYPWVPGCYRIMVLWGSERFYTTIRIRSRHLTENRLDLMRQELEETVRGIAFDLILRNRGMGESAFLLKLPKRLYQYSLLDAEFAMLQQAIIDILEKPHQLVCREYEVVHTHKGKMWDDKTLRWLNSNAGISKNQGVLHKPQFVMVPRSRVQYEMPENQWVKIIIRDVIEIVRRIQESIEKSITGWETERGNEDRIREIGPMKQVLEHCRIMQGQLWKLLNTFPFSDVKYTLNSVPPITIGILRDYRYNYLYRFWERINSDIEIQVQSAIDYQWKRTELLYEYWCFVQTIVALQYLGYTAESGWIFDKNFDDDFLIPHIVSGTFVVLSNGDNKLVVTYNQPIPFTAIDSSKLSIPVWSKVGRNKPDLRLDVYKSNKYSFSIILEVKYSRQKNVWDETLISDCNLWTPRMEQLNYYKIGIYRVDNWERPAVKHVIALYAGRPEEKEGITEISTHQITLLHLAPGLSDSHFKSFLADLIQDETL